MKTIRADKSCGFYTAIIFFPDQSANLPCQALCLTLISWQPICNPVGQTKSAFYIWQIIIKLCAHVEEMHHLIK